jgi:hypothetical protein
LVSRCCLGLFQAGDRANVVTPLDEVALTHDASLQLVAADEITLGSVVDLEHPGALAIALELGARQLRQNRGKAEFSARAAELSLLPADDH